MFTYPALAAGTSTRILQGETGELDFDVSIDGGKESLGMHKTSPAQLATISKKNGEIASVSFELAKEANGVEFRAFSKGEAKVLIQEIVIEKSQ